MHHCKGSSPSLPPPLRVATYKHSPSALFNMHLTGRRRRGGGASLCSPRRVAAAAASAAESERNQRRGKTSRNDCHRLEGRGGGEGWAEAVKRTPTRRTRSANMAQEKAPSLLGPIFGREPGSVETTLCGDPRSRQSNALWRRWSRNTKKHIPLLRGQTSHRTTLTRSKNQQSVHQTL